MLRISKHQQSALEATGLERYIDASRAFLAQRFPRLYQLRGPDKTRAWVRQGIERARGYGIGDARDIRRFVVLLYARGIGFEGTPQNSWIRDILTNEERTGRWKMDRIQEGLASDGTEH